MKKGLSPLVATVILLACAILLGTLVMNWGKDYIQTLTDIEPIMEPTGASSASPIDIGEICIQDPLLISQTRYARGEISTAKYLEMRAILTGEPLNSSIS